VLAPACDRENQSALFDAPLRVVKAAKVDRPLHADVLRGGPHRVHSVVRRGDVRRERLVAVNVPQCGGDDGVDGVRSVRCTQLTFCCRRFSGFTGGLSCPQLRYPVSYVPRCGGNGGLEGVCTFCCFNATGDRDILIFYKFKFMIDETVKDLRSNRMLSLWSINFLTVSGDAHPVSRHVGRWETAPTRVPGTAQQPDGPLCGNGDVGVVLGGARECCGGSCCNPPAVKQADLLFALGKNDFWINGPNVPTRNIGQPYTHATPGLVALEIVGDQGGNQSQRRFAATQELHHATCNASISLPPSVNASATLFSSTFVAIDHNLVVVQLWHDAASMPFLPIRLTLTSPNDWGVPTLSGRVNVGSGAGGERDAMWLRKDATHTVSNALTLAPCADSALVYSGMRDIQLVAETEGVSANLVRIINSTSHEVHCLRHHPPTTHAPNPGINASEHWATIVECGSDEAEPWFLDVEGRIRNNQTIPSKCLAYGGDDPLSVKIVVVLCAELNNSRVDLGFEWDKVNLPSQGQGAGEGVLRLRARNAAVDTNKTYPSGACLVGIRPNLNVSTAIAATLIDDGSALPLATAATCDGIVTCVMNATLQPHRRYYLLIGVMTQRDVGFQGEALDAALALLRTTDAARVRTLRGRKNEWWETFWNRSKIDLQQQQQQRLPPSDTGRSTRTTSSSSSLRSSELFAIEGWYYGMLYLIGASFAPGKVGTSHYGPFNLHDSPQCHGQLTLDYNTIAVLFGLGSGNRIEWTIPLINTLSRDDLYNLGKQRAAHISWKGVNPFGGVGHSAPFGAAVADFGCGVKSFDPEGGCPASFGGFSGIELPCAMGPYPGMFNDYDCSLRNTAGMTASALIDYYDFSLDDKFLRTRLWRFLAGVADFYTSYGVVRNQTTGEIILPYTCAQEICDQRLSINKTKVKESD
tara:strand:+ start:120 stop:2885 length:2766 start_codon:yes stop_codon:yes gene_type:complete